MNRENELEQASKEEFHAPTQQDNGVSIELGSACKTEEPHDCTEEAIATEFAEEVAPTPEETESSEVLNAVLEKRSKEAASHHLQIQELASKEDQLLGKDEEGQSPTPSPIVQNGAVENQSSP